MRLRVAAVVVVAASGVAGDSASAKLTAPGDDPTRASLIAAVERGETLRVHATPGGRAIGRIRHRTAFGSPTRLAVLERQDEWLQVSSETLGARRHGWVRLTPALRLHATQYEVTITLSRRRLELRLANRVLLSTRVAVGTPTSPTPTGRFGITDKLPGSRYRGIYGCCVLAISTVQTRIPSSWAGGNRIAMHGTVSPGSLGQAVSTGCVRVSERPLRELMRRLPLGTPVTIRR